MVKVYGPMMGLDASGSLADAITFSKWKGRNYVRQRIIPANPQSGMQTCMRTMLSALSKDWANLSAAEKAKWLTLAAASVVSPFNAFVQFNQLRMRQYKSPCIDPTDTDASLTLAAITGFAATGGVHQCTISFSVDTLNGGYGCLLHRNPLVDGDASLDEQVHVFLFHATGTKTWVDSPLTAGVWKYSYRPFTTDGLLGGSVSWVSGTVT